MLGAPGSVGWFLGNVINVMVFIAKGWILVFVMMWVRWTLPRLRIDQVMMTCLKYLLPMSCVLLFGAATWQLLLTLEEPSWLPQVLGWWFPRVLTGLVFITAVAALGRAGVSNVQPFQ